MNDMTNNASIEWPLTIRQVPVERSKVMNPEVVPIWPQWFPFISGKINRLARLEPGWDGYGASPIDHGTMVFAVDVLGQMLRPSLPEPQVVPTPEGGLQFEWHVNDLDLEIEIREPYSVALYFEDHRNHDEDPLEIVRPMLDRAIINAIATRLSEQ